MRAISFSALSAVAALVAAYAAPARAELDGVDVSRWQGAINWTSVKNAGVDFAFAKATEGVDFVDIRYTQNMANARLAGVPIGPYHFARPDSFVSDPLDAANEANDFVDAIQPYYEQYPGAYLRPVLDVEVLPDVRNQRAFLSEWIRDFADVVEDRLGESIIIYANSYYAGNYFESDLAQYDLWLANWTYDPNNPPSSSAYGIWDEWAFWQWTDSWSVPGISGAVDGDVFAGDAADLAAFLVGGGLVGDYNGDGQVGAADYNVWRSSLGSTTLLDADGDGSGVVDAADYDLWRESYGDTAPRRRPAPVPVPEPVNLLLALAGVGLAARRRHACRCS